MLGRQPRLSHRTMRWLILSLMLINGAQLVLLQATINASISLQFEQTWLFVSLSGAALLLTAVVLAFAFARGRRSDVVVKVPGAGGRGIVGTGRDD